MLVSTLMIHNIQSQHVYNTKQVDILLYIIAIEFDLKNLQKSNQVDRHIFCTSITEPFSIQQKINVSPYTLKAVTCSICITDIILKLFECCMVLWIEDIIPDIFFTITDKPSQLFFLAVMTCVLCD